MNKTLEQIALEERQRKRREEEKPRLRSNDEGLLDLAPVVVGAMVYNSVVNHNSDNSSSSSSCDYDSSSSSSSSCD